MYEHSTRILIIVLDLKDFRENSDCFRKTLDLVGIKALLGFITIVVYAFYKNFDTCS